MQDPISDMLTIIRNALAVRKSIVSVDLSNQKKAIVNVLLKEGYIDSFQLKKESKYKINIKLKYYNKKSVITSLKRVSRPSLRIYKSKRTLSKINGGFGISIVSTSEGIMSDRDARKKGLGGEVICNVF
jgi:small subunit ribosomal protein S8